MARKKQICECECCGPEKEIKAYFCPKCKSRDVGYIFGMGNVFGLIPRMKCRKCGFENMAFPLIVVKENKLKENKRKK